MPDSQPLKVKIILASGSPRRQQFLKDLDLDFEIRIKEIEEVYPDTLKGGEITAYLSELKSAAFEGSLLEDEVLITSDTIVWFEDKALGKPKDHADAFAMLQSLSGKTHQVMTSVTFRTHKFIDTITETTDVTFNIISDDQIKYYLEKYQPYDKAGSYGIQEWIGFIAVASINGSYANVMGMPVDKVHNYLITHFS